MPRLWFLFLAAAIFAAFTPTRVPAEELRLGILSELTGADAFEGKHCLEGIELARRWLIPGGVLGERRVTLVFSDHQGKTKLGAVEFRRMVHEGRVRAVIATGDAVAMSLKPLAKQLQVPLLGVVEHEKFLHNNSFVARFYPSLDVQAEALAHQAAALGGKELAALYGVDEQSLSFKEVFERAFRGGGGKVSASYTVPSDDLKLAALVNKLRQAQSDALLVFMSAQQYRRVLRELSQQRKSAALFGNRRAADPTVLEAVGPEAVEGLVFFSLNLQKKSFNERFAALYPGRFPTETSYACYSALTAALRAIASLPGGVQGVALNAALKALPDVQLLDERLPFKDQALLFDCRSKRIRAGRVEDLN